MNFIMKGSQISALQFNGWFKSKTSIQEYRNEIQKSYQTCAWIIWYMFLVQCDESRINHLTLLLEVTIPYTCWFLWQHITLRTSSDIVIFNSGLHFEGLFWERYILKSKIAFEGHWRLQSWTVSGSSKFSPSVDWNHVSKVREHLQDENTKTVLCSCRHFQVGGVIFNARVACQRLWLYLKAEKRTTYLFYFSFFFLRGWELGTLGCRYEF